MTDNIYAVNPVRSNGSYGNTAYGDSNGGMNFPPLPSMPPSNCPDPTNDPNWPPVDASGNYFTNNFNDNGIMQAVTNALAYIDDHPSDSTGYIVLAKIMYRLSGLHQPDGTSLLSIVEGKLQANGVNLSTVGNLMKDGIWYASQYGFLYGYNGGSSGTVGSFEGFAQAILAILPSSSSDPLIQAMIDGSNYAVNNANEYVNGNYSTTPPEYGHIYDGVHPPNAVDAFGNPIAKGDIIFAYNEANGDGTTTTVFYDWTAAINAENGANTPQWATVTLQKIEASIENSNPASGGPNPDIDALDQELYGLKVGDSLDTFFAVLKQTGDVGMAILAFIYEWEGYNMSSGLSGPADVMDKEKQLSQWAKQIEDDLKGLSNATPSQVSSIVGNTLALFDTIEESGQLSGGLGTAIASAMATFQSTNIAWPPGASPVTTASLWSLFTAAASGGTIDGTQVTPAALATALQNSLFPAPPTGGGSSAPPDGTGDTGSVALQGILGGFDGIITAVSSNSTAEVTSSQQMESLVQAMDKVMTGVTDKTTGINVAVIAKTLQLPS